MINRFIFLLSIPLAFVGQLNTCAQGSWQWAVDASSSNFEEALDIAVDTVNGFAYIVGRWDGSLDAVYGAGAGSLDFTTTYGGEDGFIAKYDLSGTLIWAFKVGGASNDVCNGVAVGPAGNIYVTGSYVGASEFEGTSPTVPSIAAGIGGTDIFQACYDPSGQLVWLWDDGGILNDIGTEVAVNATGVYFTGSYTEDPTTFIGGIATVSNSGGTEIFVLKRSLVGVAQWLIDGGSDADDIGNALAVDANNVYLIGNFIGTDITYLDFFVVPSSTIANNSVGTSDVTLLCMDQATGNFLWHQSIGSSLNDFGNDITVDALGFYCTGASNVNTSFPGLGLVSGQNGQDVFVSGHDLATGNANWSISEVGTGNDEGHGISADQRGNIFTTGEFLGTTTFSTQVMNTTGNSDVFVAHYTNTGAFNWAQQAGDNDPDAAYAIGAYQDDQAYVTGMFRDEITFSPLPIISTHNSDNIFLAEIMSPTELWDWADGPFSDRYEAGNSICVDESAQMVYVGGVMQRANGIYTDILTTELNGTTNNLQNDGFVAKYDFNGNVIWSFNIGGDGDDEVTGVTVDETTGNIYITGYFEGDWFLNGTSFDGHIAGASGDVLVGGFGGQEVFTAAYSSAGALIWWSMGTSPSDDAGLDVAVNANGIYVTGYYDDVCSFGSFTQNFPSTGTRNNFVVAYDKGTGNELWFADMGSPSTDEFDFAFNHQKRDYGIVADDANVYVAQTARGSTVFDIYDGTGALVNVLIDVGGNDNNVVIAFDDNGTYQWVNYWDDLSGASGDGVDIAVDCDGVYVSAAMHAGSTTPQGTLISGSHDNSILVQLDKATGAELWVRQLVSAGSHQDYILGIDADNYGNVYAVGIMSNAPLDIETPVSVHNESTVNGEDIFILRYQNDGTFQSFERIDGTGNDFATDVSVHTNSDLFITGISSNVTTFPPYSISTAENENIFVAKKSIIPVGAPLACIPVTPPTQEWDWKVDITNTDNDLGNDVVVDAVGNSYVIGNFEGTINFATTPVTSFTSNGLNDIFIAKYDPNGVPLWARHIGGPLEESGNGITVDVSGNVYACGSYASNPVSFYDPPNPTLTATNDGNDDSFIVKYDNNGTLIWEQTPNGSNRDYAYGIVADATDIYVVGSFRNGIDFGGGPQNNFPSIGGAQEDGWIAKYDFNGVIDWAKRIEGAQTQEAVSVDENAGFIYVTGYSGNDNVTFDGTPDITLINIGEDDYWIGQFNKANGRVIWARQGGDVLLDDKGLDVVVSGTSVYATGYFQGTADFGSGGILSAGGQDIFVTQYDFSGNLLNAWAEGGIGSDVGTGIDEDTGNDIYVTGWFNGTANFDGYTVTATSGGQDLFITRYSPSGTLAWLSQGIGSGLDSSAAIGIGPTDHVSVTGKFNGGDLQINTAPISPPLTWNSNDDFFLAHIGFCNNPPIANNSISADQSICAFLAPAPLDGLPAIGGDGATYFYLWEESGDGVSWGPATGINNMEDYSPPILTVTTYYRRLAWSGCAVVDVSNTVTITVSPEWPGWTSPGNVCISDPIIDLTTVVNPLKSGWGDAVTAFLGMPNQLNILGSPDGAGADFLTNGDYIVVDLTDTIPAGQLYYVTWRQTPLAPGTSNMELYESEDGVAFTLNTATPLSTSNENYFVQAVLSENATRYIRFERPVGSQDFQVDAVTYSFQGGIGGTWSGTGVSGNNFDPAVAGIGTHAINYQVGMPGCLDDSTNTITVEAPQDASFSYPSAAYCQSGIDPLPTPVTPGGSYTGPAGIVFTDGSPSSTGTIDLSLSAVGGPYAITYTTPNSCGAVGTFNVTIEAPQVATFSYSSATFCQSDPDPVPTPTVAGGTWTGPVGIVFTDGSPSPTGTIDLSASTAGGPYTITYATPNSCAATGTFNVTILSPTTTADAGLDQLICTGSSATMAGNTPASGTGLWTLVSGSGTITTPSSPTTTITGLGPGVNQFQWTISNAPCSPSSDVVNIELDNTAPIINCPANFNENANASCQFTIPDYTGLGLVSDNCGVGGVTVTQSPVVGTNVGLGATGITLTATDGAGNSASCNFTITVVDPLPPTVIGCPANIMVNNDPGACAAVVSWVAPTASDNCAGVGIAQTAGLFSGSSFPIGTSTVEYTATDGYGNTALCSFTITVVDNEAPFAGCFGDVSVNAAFGACDAIASWTTPIVTDNCPGATISQTGGPASGSTFPIGSTLITYTATDAAGNTNTCSFNVNVSDAQDPVITGCPSDITVSNDMSSCGAIVSWVTPSFTDNCSGGSIAQTTGLPSGSLFPVGTNVVEFTATDAAGNTATCTFNVIVNDNESPAMVCPSDQNSFVNASCEFDLLDYTSMAVVSDNCTASGSIVVTQLPTPGTTVTANTVVTLTADDGNGNTSNCNFNIILVDNTTPVVSCPAGFDEYVDSNCDFIIPDYYSLITVSDNCDASPSIVQTPAVGATISGHGTVQVITFDVQDASGNSSSCSFNITLQDTTSPSLICPPDQTEAVGPGCTATLSDYTPLAISSDNCGTVAITQSPVPATVISTNTTITLTADDGNGNTTTCQFEVLLDDIVPPSIVCPNDTTVDNDMNMCDAFVTLSVPVVSDNCGVTSLLNDYNITGDATDNYPVGTTTVTWTVEDGNGNTNTCSMDITVVDVELPAMSCIGDTVIAADPGSCDAVFNYVVSATDNCLVSYSQITGLTSGSVFPGGTTVNTFVAQDTAGNTDTCSFSVTVIDSESPSIICPNDVTECDSIFTLGTPVVADNCMINTVLNDFNGTADASGLYPFGTTVVTWTVTDTAGNTNTCVSTVTADEMPWPVDAGPDQTLDFSFDTYLNASVSVVGSGTWSNDPGNGNIWTPTDPYSYIDQLGVGENVITWTVVNGTCPPVSDEVIIYVNDFEIPQAITPNGDGKNDYFVIHGIENPENEVQIFNRWGQLVYEAINYQNDWYGVDHSGAELSNDTYFYVITMGDEMYDGYVVIKR